MIDEALSQQKYDLALELAEEAYKVCAQSAGRNHRKRAFDRRKQVQALAASWREVQAVLDKLKTAPDDPAANLAAGRHYCFDRGDWDKGLAHLAKSSDADLKKLARQETQSPPSDPAAMLKLADAWWSLSESRQGSEKQALQLRAGTWYREAEPEITSTLLKAKVEKRLADIAKLGRPIPEPSFQGPPPPAIAPFNETQAKRHQQRWANYLGVPVETTNSVGMKLVLIPPGEYDMGSTQEEIEQLIKDATGQDEREWYAGRVRSGGPQHHVRITRPWRLGAYEVTVGQFRKFVEATRYQTDAQRTGEGVRREFPQTDDHPARDLSWNDAVAFCKWLSAKEGTTYRLPTEAEWEYACRAGTTTRFCFGNDQRRLDEYAWWEGNSERVPHPVGQKRPNPWGLYDMYGNIWEWCSDWYADDYYGRSPQDDPTGPTSGGRRVLRGATFCSDQWGLPSAFRTCELPNRPVYNYGFRVVCEIPARRAVGASPPPAIGPFGEAQAKRHQQRWAKHLGAAVEKTNSIGMKLVLIPPGEFDMGSTKEEIDQVLDEMKQRGLSSSHIARVPAEGPQHRVRITKPFFMGACEVTVGQFRAFIEASAYTTEAEKANQEATWRNALRDQTDAYPVANVTWKDADAFCHWLSQKEGRTYRLPTEAEWEYACRAGATARFCHGNDEATFREYANIDRRTCPVGQKRPNCWGLYDVHGNLWEWCADRYDADYYHKSPPDDPAGPESGFLRVYRGGSWCDSPVLARCALRGGIVPHYRGVWGGFRVVEAKPSPFSLSFPSSRHTSPDLPGKPAWLPGRPANSPSV